MNTKRDRLGTGSALALIVTALGLGACTDYGVNTVVDRDGGGTRVETVRVSRSGDDTTSAQEYVQLMNLGEGKGWSHRTEVDKDTTWVFERRHQIRDAAGWSALSGTIRIDGTTPRYATTRVGRTTLGDVRFSNRVEVTRGRSTAGATYTYRESFSWDKAVEPIVEFFTRAIDDTLSAMYPRLAPEQRGELKGLVRAGLWSMIDAGVLGPDTSGEDEDTLVDRFVSRTGREAADVVAETYPQARADVLEAILRKKIDDDEETDAFLQSRLPGLALAVSFELRLTMPGHVTDSNADSVEGDTLVWKFDQGDALTAPVQLHAESVVQGG